MTSGLIEHFEDLPDPRVRGRTDYPLIEIVFLCISAIISGFDGWEAIEDFGKGKLEWLRKPQLWVFHEQLAISLMADNFKG